MDYELIVRVLVEALDAGTIAADAMHARGGIAGELDPLGFERVKLRMDDGARERNGMPVRAIEASSNKAGLVAAFVCRGEPFAIGADGTFT